MNNSNISQMTKRKGQDQEQDPQDETTTISLSKKQHKWIKKKAYFEDKTIKETLKEVISKGIEDEYKDNE